MPPPTSPSNTVRSPWIAGLASFLFPGLGQYFCGRFRRAILIAIAGLFIVAVWVLTMTHIAMGPLIWWLCTLPVVIWRVWAIVDAVLVARHFNSQKSVLRHRWASYVLFAASIFAVTNLWAYALRSLVAEALVIPTDGMAKTIIGGDRIMCDKLAYQWGDVKHGDVVVFMIYLEEQANSGPLPDDYNGYWSQYIKRVIGLPGDTIEIRNELVFRNGIALEEPYANLDGELPPYQFKNVDMANMPPTKVPKGEFFFMGDSRRSSYDSRYLGTIPLDQIKGRATTIVWSSTGSALNQTTKPDRELPKPPSRIRWERLGMKVK